MRNTKKSFHPFQGRPPFGQEVKACAGRAQAEGVSIPFREDLHSDTVTAYTLRHTKLLSFHPFQGRPPFGQIVGNNATIILKLFCFHPFQGRPPFGQWVDSVPLDPEAKKFPSLSGKTSIRTETCVLCHLFPFNLVSIPFREDLHSDAKANNLRPQLGTLKFPSLSGKTSIRTTIQTDP